ncbi:MAG: hypothetical protein RL173_2030 [Fibrobacterota bacterium]
MLGRGMVPFRMSAGQRPNNRFRDVNLASEIRTEALSLGERLVAKLPGGQLYQHHLLDSGAEALEMAIGHAYQVHLEGLRSIHEKIRATVSDLWLQASTTDLRWLPEGGCLADFLDDLEQRNLGALESFMRHPVMLAFHPEKPVVGSGALGPRLRNACRNACEGVLEPRVVGLERRGGDGIDCALRVHRCQFRIPCVVEGRIEVVTRSESLVFACVVGPSESGDGICQIAPETASSLVFRPGTLPLVIEESRMGCPSADGYYAFGRSALSQARPEYVVLSKVMGGWGSKIGAAMVRSDVLRSEFALDPDEGCSDAFSLGVALSVLEAIEST